MADAPSPDSTESSGDTSKGFTLDLSTGKAPSRRKRKRKGPAPVVQQTINLSTPKPEKPVEPTADASSKNSRPSGPSNRSKTGSPGGRKQRPAPPSGTSLADLLDPETLARLRGGA